MTTRLRVTLALVTTTAAAMALIAGPASATITGPGSGSPGDRIVPAPRPCLKPASPSDIRQPRPCLPDVPTPRPCEWNPDKERRCLYGPFEVYLVSAKSDLLPPLVPGPYDPITDMQGGTSVTI
ncbi:MAG: hypothetical protein IPJ61_12885 [Tessaracoccus sp.]|uniref:hypothetical protein n=1 Tax=Tessaracoccus sp. TaxID=1971211 RepID=UPI001EB6322D|nr:hypothetical protein [Tessaracoccus sp.]MBK7821936.1 hypothetical protein [Tessaracoccus sp.]